MRQWVWERFWMVVGWWVRTFYADKKKYNVVERVIRPANLVAINMVVSGPQYAIEQLKAAIEENESEQGIVVGETQIVMSLTETDEIPAEVTIIIIRPDVMDAAHIIDTYIVPHQLDEVFISRITEEAVTQLMVVEEEDLYTRLAKEYFPEEWAHEILRVNLRKRIQQATFLITHGADVKMLQDSVGFTQEQAENLKQRVLESVDTISQEELEDVQPQDWQN